MALPLFADLYQFTMLHAYWALGMSEPATFSLFVRKLPPGRNYLVACGLADALAEVEKMRFSPEDVEHLRSLGLFPPKFLEYLARLRFTGHIDAIPEGELVFENEPILEVTAPIGQAQIVETFLMNQIGLQTLLSSKAARIVKAAAGRPVVDFGSRRAQGLDAALKGARAFAIAGVSATSNVLAGQIYGLPVTGTVAHSFIAAFDSEGEAFQRFAHLYPTTILLVDTYDTLHALEKIVRLIESGRLPRTLRGIRLDSGDLDYLSRAARIMLDQAGLANIQIFVSGGLDETKIDALVAAKCPIDAFGVGTAMSVSSDAPDLDFAYKLTEYGGKGRMKLAAGKHSLPCRKQVYRQHRHGVYTRDIIALHDELVVGEPLLQPAMQDGRMLEAVNRAVGSIRTRAKDRMARFPEAVLGLAPLRPPYCVEISPALRARERSLREALVRTGGELRS
ncbi:nicotinate phosphoribosyltransferase [Alsobacter sp. KACC 23698]|uniref:Nicotinate phosphoribosyltransferase n=1 Tax=Alsobacter sp. KACC 23698 TaxID=3149229 RepID=A0AAU7JF25_9HYPH